MDDQTRKTIISILEDVGDMTIATQRDDGFPQATTVGFVNDGMAIYFGTFDQSQKAHNIARSNKVSLTVNRPYDTWQEIVGLSIGGLASPVTSPDEVEKVGQLLLAKFPQIPEFASTAQEGLALFRIDPVVISLLDYRKGFGHSELIRL